VLRISISFGQVFSRQSFRSPAPPIVELTATCCVKLRLSLSTFKSRLKTHCFLLLSVNCSTYLFHQRLCSRLTALWRFINFVLLLILLLIRLHPKCRNLVRQGTLCFCRSCWIVWLKVFRVFFYFSVVFLLVAILRVRFQCYINRH